MLSVERRKKAAERQRAYRQRVKDREAAQAAAVAAGEAFVVEPKLPRDHHLIPFRFKPGHTTTRKGVRNRFGQDFIVALHQHFLERGYGVFDDLLANQPAIYARLLAAVASKQVEVHAGIASEFSDEYVLRLIESLDRWVAAHPDAEQGAVALSPVSEAEDVS